jgi:TetR/AcrR family acrAB operon transcriptional repressor
MARRTAEDAAKTRDAIVDAALEVFAERGHAVAQLEEIALRASVTRGALYHHFEGKDELFVTVLRERWNQSMAPIVRHLEGPGGGEERLRAFIMAFFRAADSEPATRALLEISLAREIPPDPDQAGLGAKLRALGPWLKRIEDALKATGRHAGVRVLAETLLTNLIGYAVWSALQGPGSASCYQARCSAMLEGILR